LANNSSPVSNVQFKTYADANDQFLAWSPATGNDVIVPVQNLFSVVPLVVGATITVGNSSGVVINTTAIAIDGVVLAGGGGYAGGNLIPSIDGVALLGNTTDRFLSLNVSNGISIGNSTVGATINTTAFSGQANSALFIGGVAAANVVSNAQLEANLAQYQPTVTLGAAVAALTANAANFIGSLPAGSVANTSAPAFSTSIEVGGAGNNVFANTTAVRVGNSTINATMNSSSFSGSSNNTLFVGATSAANVVSNAQLAANLATFTPTAGLAAAIAGMSVNNAVNLNGLPSTSYANTSNATIVNLAVTTETVSNSVTVGNSVVNTTTMFIGNSTAFHLSNAVASVISNSSSNVSINSDAILIGNGGVFTIVNSTSFSGTSNNTLFVAGTAAGNVVSNAQLQANLANLQTLAGLPANVATLTANDANFLGGLPAASYANTSAPVFTTLEVGTVANNVSINSTAVSVGNSTVNNSINSTSYSGTALTANNATHLGGLAAASFANNSTPAISNAVLVGANVTINTSAIFIGPSTDLTGNSLTTITLNVSNTITQSIIANGSVGLTGQALLSAGPGSNVYWGTVTGGSGSGNGVYGNPNQIAYNNAGTETGDANFTWQSSNVKMTVGAIGNTVVITNNDIIIGNSSVNNSINSTFYTGLVNNAITSFTSNNSLNLGGLLAVNYANTSQAVITTFGANVATINSVSVGNSTSNSTVNSTIYTGTSNNVLYVGSTAAANVVSNAMLAANLTSYQTTAGLAANVAVLAANSASFIGTLPSSNVANNTSPVITTQVSVGNSTVNAVINTTSLTVGPATMTGTQLTIANVVPNIVVANGGVGLSTQALLSGGPGSNVYWGTVSGSGGGNGVYGNPNQIAYNNAGVEAGDANFTWQSSNIVMTVGATGNTVAVTNNLITLGNSTVNSTINSTAFSGRSATATLATSATSALTANSAAFLGTLAAASYANNSAPLITTSVTVGNSTVNNTINATSYSGVSNNTLFVGATSAANVVSNAMLSGNLASYQPMATLASAVSGLLANNTSFVGSVSAANVVSNNQLSSNLASYQTTAGLAANVALLAANNASFLGGVAASGYANTSSPTITTSIAVGGGANQVYSNTTTLLIGNSTVFDTVNSTIFTGTALTANSAAFLGALAAASYANNSAPIITTTLEVGAVGNNVTINTTAVAIGNSTVNNSINSTSYSGVAFNALNLGGLPAASYANDSAPTISTSVLIGATGTANNVAINTTAIAIGNSTVNNSINSTSYSGVANNALSLGGLTAANYANLSAPVFTVTANVGANVGANTIGFAVSNGIISSSMTAALLSLGGQVKANNLVGTAGQVLTSGASGNAYWATIAAGAVGTNSQIAFNNSGVEAGDANLTWNAIGAMLTVGNSTINTQITSTSFTGTANNSLNLGGLSATSYANTTAPVIANTVQVGTGFSNGVIINSTAVFMGNVTVFGTINTTNYTGTSNNANNLGGLAAASYANTSSATILVLAANTLSIGNSLSNATANSTTISIANVVIGSRITANGLVGSSGQVLTSGGGTSNAYWVTPAPSAPGSNTQIAFNNSGVEAGDANLTWNTTTATLTVGNSTVFTTANGTSFSGTANNSLFLGGLAAAGYANLSVAPFTTSVNVGSVNQINTTAITIGNATATFIANSSMLVLPGILQANGSNGTASYVLTSGGSGANAYWAIGGGGGGTPGGTNTMIQFNASGSFQGDANLTWNTATGTMGIGNSTSNLALTQLGLVLGNSSVNTSINSTGVSVNTAGTAAALSLIANIVVSGVVNTTQNTVITGANLVMNYWNGNTTVNTSSSLTLNASALFIGNSVSNTTINSTSFAQVQAANGYTRLPGGLIIQWGSCATTTTSTLFAWPIAFASNAYNVHLQSLVASGAAVTPTLQSFTGANFHCNTSVAGTVLYYAIGL